MTSRENDQFPYQAAERYWKQVACVTLYKLSLVDQLFLPVNGFLLLCIYPCAHLIHVCKMLLSAKHYESCRHQKDPSVLHPVLK